MAPQSVSHEDILLPHLNRLLSSRDHPKTICPSEIPRALTAAELEALGVHAWRDLMPTVRQILWDMRRRGEVEILQRGIPVSDTAELQDIKETDRSPYTLPRDFLFGPGPEKTVQKIDFARISLPEYGGHYAVVIDNTLTKEECDSLVRAAEAKNGGEWEQAMVNVGGGRQELMTDARDCGRIIWDDRDIVEKIWSRVKDSVPEIEFLKDLPSVTGNWPVARKETLKISRLNERMRFLRYEDSHYFRPHVDGTFATPDNQEKSFFTLHLYLNESDPEAPEGPLVGGATTFHSYNMQRSYDINPKVGRVLIFQHRNLLHSGADVMKGIKMTLRTDLMYKVHSRAGVVI